MIFDKVLICDKCECTDIATRITVEKTIKEFTVMLWDERLNKYIEVISRKEVGNRVSCGRCGNVLEVEQ